MTEPNRPPAGPRAPAARLRAPALAALLVVLTGGAAMAETRTIAGEVAYRERIALPPGTDLALELRDAAGALVAEFRDAAGDRQVPLPFSVAAPEGALTLRAALFSAGAPAWASDPVDIPAGEADVALGTVALRRHPAMGFATLFRCGESVVGVSFAGEVARLRIAGTYADLAPVAAASGARYEAPGDPGTWVWSKGNEVTVGFRGATLPACTPAVAGSLAPFVARGNEPFWTLAIDGDTATFTPLSGAALTGRLAAPEAVPESMDGARRYTAEGADLVVTVADRIARDSMTGMPHPATVTVEAGGVTLAGTGGDPAALIAGVVWRAEDVGGTGIPDGAEVTLEFRDGRAAGRSGCNRYTGGYTLSGEGLSFGQMAGTMMACPEALMTLERDFLGVLSRTTRFDIDATGALVLYAGDDPVALLRH